jgi:hypothetical protein
MQMRSLLLTVLGAAVVIAGAEVTLREVEEHLPVLSDWPTIETEIKSSQFEALATRPALLMVGASMTESAIDPQLLEEMGVTPAAYNTAFPFFSPAAAELWLREFLQPWDDLEVILIGLPVWPPPRDSANDPLTVALLEAATDESAAGSFEDIALWRLRGMLVDVDKAARRERATVNHLWTDLGHQTYYYERSGGSVSGNYPPYLHTTMSDMQERALRRIIEAARQSDVTPIVLLEPGRYPNEVDDQMITDYMAWLRDLADELEVEFWDGYSIGWDPSFYADETHFNEKGAIAFTRYVGERLLELSDG